MIKILLLIKGLLFFAFAYLTERPLVSTYYLEHFLLFGRRCSFLCQSLMGTAETTEYEIIPLHIEIQPSVGERTIEY